MNKEPNFVFINLLVFFVLTIMLVFAFWGIQAVVVKYAMGL